MTITSLNPVGRALRSARVRAALSLGVVATVGATGTFAYWTDSVTIAGATFTAASIDLQVNGSNTVTGDTPSTWRRCCPVTRPPPVLTMKQQRHGSAEVHRGDDCYEYRREEPGRSE